jgi:branched-subunit amino acid aminotransferase/4-amino-4-deoxychorismate lyase
VVTPPLRSGVLPGVTREVVMRLARRAAMPVREEPIPIARLRRADEVFLTASTIEVMPVVRLGSHRLGSGTPGPVTRRLQGLYRAHVGRLRRRARRRSART